jgi:hypothetical protein
LIIIGIDPGPEKSGYVAIDVETAEVKCTRVLPNNDVGKRLSMAGKDFRICAEMPASYGMSVGATVMETAEAVGYFRGKCRHEEHYHKMYRKTIATALCGQAKAKGPYIRQCIIDMYGAGAIGGKKCKQCKGKGWFGAGRPTCTACTGTGWNEPPGPLYHVKSHAWDALAVALAYAIQAGYLNPLVVNPEGLGKNFQSPAHDGLSGIPTGSTTPQDEPF